jgi:hypothetical protein
MSLPESIYRFGQVSIAINSPGEFWWGEENGGRLKMLKLAFTGVISILLSFGGFFGYQWYRNRPPATEESEKAASMEEVKTDFISIAVFKDGKVDGYVTFRAKLLLKDEDRMAEAGYLVADAIHRKLDTFSNLFGDNFRPKDAKLLEEPLLAALSDRLGVGEIGSIVLTDIAYDNRIQ